MIDYLAIGHVTRDVTPDGLTAGGSVTFSSRVAQALGCKTAVVTSAANDFDFGRVLPGIDVVRVPSEVTTTFENVYTERGRKQTIRSVASEINTKHIPTEWLRAKIVHLAPVANEVSPGLISLFSNSLVGLTPQGWYRRWQADGRVYVGDWPSSQEVIKLAGAVIISPDDLPNKEAVNQIRDWCQLVVVTLQSDGCIVYFRDDSRVVTAPVVSEVNPTGAGDIFATSFLVRLFQTRGNPWESAAFANKIAALSVAGRDLAEKISIIKNNLNNDC